MHNFENGLFAWFQLPIGYRDWVTFNTHFEAAYALLKVVRGPAMKSTAYHQVNMLQAQVLTQMKDVKASVDQALAQLPTTSSHSYSDQMCMFTTTQDNMLEMIKFVQIL